jgi:endonuclease YncB( thermonuclease family)
MSDSNEAPPGGPRFWRPSMILAALAVSFAVLVFLRPDPPAPKAEGPIEANAEVVSELAGIATVRDGDTVLIGERRVRFDGILAPERRTSCGGVDVYRGAIDALRSVTRSNHVRCRISDTPDADGTTVAQCSTEDQADLGAYMVANGWARDWPAYSGGAYADEEAAARAAQRGIWSPSCPANLWGDRDFSARE